LIGAGHLINGADMVVASSVPRGAGLSSSAALEVATGYMFQLFHNLNILGEELALMSQATENQFVGVNCGIMNQFIVTLGKANHALLIDCRDLSYQEVSVPANVASYPSAIATSSAPSPAQPTTNAGLNANKRSNCSNRSSQASKHCAMSVVPSLPAMDMCCRQSYCNELATSSAKTNA
jgi:galactokinase